MYTNKVLVETDVTVKPVNELSVGESVVCWSGIMLPVKDVKIRNYKGLIIDDMFTPTQEVVLQYQTDLKTYYVTLNYSNRRFNLSIDGPGWVMEVCPDEKQAEVALTKLMLKYGIPSIDLGRLEFWTATPENYYRGMQLLTDKYLHFDYRPNINVGLQLTIAANIVEGCTVDDEVYKGVKKLYEGTVYEVQVDGIMQHRRARRFD